MAIHHAWPRVKGRAERSAAYVSALYATSWAIKAMEQLPGDVTADDLWLASPE